MNRKLIYIFTFLVFGNLLIGCSKTGTKPNKITISYIGVNKKEIKSLSPNDTLEIKFKMDDKQGKVYVVLGYDLRVDSIGPRPYFSLPPYPKEANAKNGVLSIVTYRIPATEIPYFNRSDMKKVAYKLWVFSADSSIVSNVITTDSILVLP